MADTTDKSFIDEVPLTLSNHTMRKRRGGGTSTIDNAMPDSTILFIRLNDANKTQVIIDIDHDPRNVIIHKHGRSQRPRYYKLYGDGIDTQKLFELTREF
jgi:hypothetical protein